MALHVVSTPAIRTSAAMPSTMPSSSGAPSTSAPRSSLSRSSPGLRRRSASCDWKYSRSCSAPCDRRASSSANSRTSRTHPVKASDISLETPRMRAITRTGYLLRVVDRGIRMPGVDEAVEQAPAELPGQRHVALHALMGEPRQQQTPGPGVQRRIGRDRGEPVLQLPFALVAVAHRDHGHLERAEVLDVVRHGRDVLVAGGEPGAPPPLGVRDRARGAQVVPDAEGVGRRSAGRGHRSHWPSR